MISKKYLEVIIMDRYIEVKLIEAKPMNLIDAEEKLQRKIKYGNEPGFLVKYPDGYESWSPKDVFDEAYRKIDGLTFGLAIEALKKGFKVARKGWNGKGMWLGLVKADNYIINFPPHNGEDTVDGECKGLLPWIGMKTADDKFVPWLASQTDVLAEDWVIVSE